MIVKTDGLFAALLLTLTERGEGEANQGAEGGPHVPAVLEGGEGVHRDPEHGDQQLRADQVHQQQVELSPQLQHSRVQGDSQREMVGKQRED